MTLEELAAVLVGLGCPPEKSAEMAAQLDKRARQLAEQKGRTYEDDVGLAGLKRLGKRKWRRHVNEIVKLLKAALEVDYVVLGGGNARLIKKLPPGSCLGNNANAFRGGYHLWSKAHTGPTRERFVH